MIAPHAQRLLPWITAGLTALVAYGAEIADVRLQGDETPYACAFAAMRAGTDPYACERFFYPPPMAALGGLLAQWTSLESAIVAMRIVNVAAAVAIVGWTARGLPFGAVFQALAAAALMSFGPSVREAIDVGNLSPAASGLAFAGLFAWPRRPIAAGAFLGASVALKPLAAVALPLLLLHRSTLADGRRSQWTASVVAGVTVVLALAPWMGLLPSMFAHAPDHGRALNNVSVQRLGDLLGLETNAAAVFLLVGAAFAIALRRCRVSPPALMHACCAASLLSLPVVWCHTFILAYPLCAAALSRAIAGVRAAPPEQRARAGLQLALVIAACAVVMQSDLFGALGEWLPNGAVALALAVGLTLPTTLTAYAVRSER